jgi:protein-L-isoaspartate O-methyltransferase
MFSGTKAIKEEMSSLVELLKKEGMLKSERVAHAMRLVDRAEFVTAVNRPKAYENKP